MNGITRQTIFLITMIKIIVGYQRLIDVVKEINYENRIEINVIINLFENQQDDQLNELLQHQHYILLKLWEKLNLYTKVSAHKVLQ